MKGTERILQLEEGYRIIIDGPNLTLEQLKCVASKEKAPRFQRGDSIKKKWNVIGYYTTVIPALRRYCHLTLNASESVVDLLHRLENLENMFENLLVLYGPQKEEEDKEEAK